MFLFFTFEYWSADSSQKKKLKRLSKILGILEGENIPPSPLLSLSSSNYLATISRGRYYFVFFKRRCELWYKEVKSPMWALLAVNDRVKCLIRI